MLLAYRRGLLEPDYKYGLQSRIREKIILEMLDKEQAADALLTSATLRCLGLAPAIRPDAAVDFVNSFEDILLKVAYFKEYSNDVPKAADTSARAIKRDTVNLVKAFNMLTERGIIEEFRKAAAKAVEDLQEES